MKKIIVLLLAVLLLAATVMPCAAAKVQRSKQKTTVDGSLVTCEVYNIDGSNYYKLRDLAKLLNGTAAQFSISWDAKSGTIAVQTSKPYKAVGGELVIGADKSATAKSSPQSLTVNGRALTGLSAYNIGGNNYFKLRDICDWLYFTVDYNEIADTVAIGSEEISGCATGDCGKDIFDDE